MKNSVLILVSASVSISALLASGSATAQTGLIDFETLPGGRAPAEGMVISNQFFSSLGVSFAFTNGTFPVLAMRRGTEVIAFAGPNGDNTFAPNQGVGNYFLTDPDATIGLPPCPLVITYREAVSNASGVVIDIDGSPSLGGNEAWLLEARGADGTLLATNRLTVASPNSGDGKATPWAFKGIPGIRSIHVIYDGHKTNKVGLAFDNFSPALPIAPPSLSLTVTQAVVRLGLAGSFSGNYRIEWASSLSAPNWQTLTNLCLTNAPEEFLLDPDPSTSSRRYYRAVGL